MKLEDAIKTGTYAALPAAATIGRLYVPTDSYYNLLRDTGSAWVPFRDGQQMTLPVSGDFSWVNQGSATVDTTYGATFLSVPASASLSIRARVKTAPSTPYTITAAFMVEHARANSSGVGAGLCWRESGTGEIITWGPVPGNTGNHYEYVLIKMTDATTYASEYGTRFRHPPPSVVWLRISDDGTDRRAYWSEDGRYWRIYHTAVGRTDFLTANQVGFYGDNVDANVPCGVALIHWAQT